MPISKKTAKAALKALGYVVFMALFFFIGLPKMKIVPLIVGFLVVSGFYFLGVAWIKKILAGWKP